MTDLTNTTECHMSRVNRAQVYTRYATYMSFTSSQIISQTRSHNRYDQYRHELPKFKIWLIINFSFICRKVSLLKQTQRVLRCLILGCGKYQHTGKKFSYPTHEESEQGSWDKKEADCTTICSAAKGNYLCKKLADFTYLLQSWQDESIVL